MRLGDALLLAVTIAALVLLAPHVPGVKLVAEAAHPHTCPAGTFLAADGFCTHGRPLHPTPAR